MPDSGPPERVEPKGRPRRATDGRDFRGTACGTDDGVLVTTAGCRDRTAMPTLSEASSSLTSSVAAPGCVGPRIHWPGGAGGGRTRNRGTMSPPRSNL